ncbi:MAG: restriction endonuclease subunit S [Bacillota bacterium]|nr:restriction endonuclease subunit S [Bacillota bacterium]
MVREGDVLVSTTRPNLNAVAMVPPHLDDQICSTGFCVLRATEAIHPAYLFAYVQNGAFVRSLSESVKGALYPAVTNQQVRSQWVPLPPIGEQQRIAEILHVQMAYVERARAAAEDRLEAAKALPAAYLRTIFESPTAHQWTKTPLGCVGEVVSGVTLGRKLNSRSTRTVPYMRVANVKDGYLDLSGVYEIEATEDEIEKCRLRQGDLLLTEGGDPDKLGRGTVWDEQIPECIHQNHIFRVRFPQDQLLPEFVSAQIGSSYGKAYFLRHAKQTTGIATINQKVLKAFPLIVPPMEEQRRIVGDLNAQLTRAGNLREALLNEMDALNVFPAALLRRAFAGEL